VHPNEERLLDTLESNRTYFARLRERWLGLDDEEEDPLTRRLRVIRLVVLLLWALVRPWHAVTNAAFLLASLAYSAVAYLALLLVVAQVVVWRMDDPLLMRFWDNVPIDLTVLIAAVTIKDVTSLVLHKVLPPIASHRLTTVVCRALAITRVDLNVPHPELKASAMYRLD
jgi:hypothetical protein